MNTESTNELGSALHEAERMFARVWRLLALRGVVAIAFAFVLLIWPDIGLTAMVTVVGAFAIASGFVSGVAAYALPGAAKQHRVWLALSSLLGLAVGTAVLVGPTSPQLRSCTRSRSGQSPRASARSSPRSCCRSAAHGLCSPQSAGS